MTMNQKRQGQELGSNEQSATRVILLLCLILHFLATSAQQEDPNWEKQWCIADQQTPDDVLQQALSWACGPGGANCTMIQPNKYCYFPNNVKDHASYAFNSYWQKFKKQGGSCYFNAAAMVTDLDPSHDSCHFEVVP
uniref:X8 domain-containing protein n=1 Tax=Oryza glumipatula TaxID=40148 RepID=A0A0D9ZD82_9ORYZ